MLTLNQSLVIVHYAMEVGLFGKLKKKVVFNLLLVFTYILCIFILYCNLMTEAHPFEPPTDHTVRTCTVIMVNHGQFKIQTPECLTSILVF